MRCWGKPIIARSQDLENRYSFNIELIPSYTTVRSAELLDFYDCSPTFRGCFHIECNLCSCLVCERSPQPLSPPLLLLHITKCVGNIVVSIVEGGLRGKEEPHLVLSTLERSSWIYTRSFIQDNEQFCSKNTSSNLCFTRIASYERQGRPEKSK